jgi:hypothetical protein
LFLHNSQILLLLFFSHYQYSSQTHIVNNNSTLKSTQTQSQINGGNNHNVLQKEAKVLQQVMQETLNKIQFKPDGKEEDEEGEIEPPPAPTKPESYRTRLCRHFLRGKRTKLLQSLSQLNKSLIFFFKIREKKDITKK